MSAGRTWFGVGGALALLLGAFFQSPQWLYRSDFASVDYDYVRNESQCPDISVGDVELPCLPLPPTALGDFERTGFLVLRQAGCSGILVLALAPAPALAKHSC